MIVVDTSCLIAILENEPEKRVFEEALAGEERYVMSAVNVHEAVCVMQRRRGREGVARLWDLLGAAGVEIAPFDEAQVRAAALAFELYGKGVNAKASLNICDCAAYALAKTMSAPLLFKGRDFIHTDIQRA